MKKKIQRIWYLVSYYYPVRTKSFFTHDLKHHGYKIWSNFYIKFLLWKIKLFHVKRDK